MQYDPEIGWYESRNHPFKVWDLNPITESTSFLEDLKQLVKDYNVIEKVFADKKEIYKLQESMNRIKRKYNVS